MQRVKHKRHAKKIKSFFMFLSPSQISVYIVSHGRNIVKRFFKKDEKISLDGFKNVEKLQLTKTFFCGIILGTMGVQWFRRGF
jgi:hypothetical protein